MSARTSSPRRIRRSSPRRSPPRDTDTDSFLSDPITLSSDEEKDLSSDEEDEEEDEVYLQRMLKRNETYASLCERREKGFNDFINRWTSVLGDEREEPPESAFRPHKHYEIPRDHLIDRKSSPRRARA